MKSRSGLRALCAALALALWGALPAMAGQARRKFSRSTLRKLIRTLAFEDDLRGAVDMPWASVVLRRVGKCE
jgi:hypothetical protein